MTVAAQQRHTRAHRCPVCGGADGDPRGKEKRCHGFTSADAEWAHCSREEHAGALEQEAGGTYAHRLRGPCKCGVEHGPDLRPRDEVEALYDYRDEQGALLFQVVRKAGKRFQQRKPDGAGGWEWKLNGVRRVPYRLRELLEDDGDRPVYVVEGEKDCETLTKRGYTATTNPGGAGKWSAVADVARTALQGRDVVVIADRDEVGRRHACEVEASLRDVARSVRIVECTRGKDASDHLAAGGTLEELVPLGANDAEPAPEPNASIVLLDGAAIARPLPELDYLVRELGLVAGGGAPHMVAGYGFSGKTLALQALLLAFAAGAKLWSAYAVRPLPVVHIDLEQGDRLTRRRYQRLARAQGIELAALGSRIAAVIMPPLTLTAGCADQWKRVLDGRAIAVIDSMRAASPGQDENSSDIRAGLDMLGKVSEQTGCRPIIVHHARKPNEDTPGGRYSIRGSSAIFDALDSAFVFAAAKGEPVKVSCEKARSHGDLAEDFALVIADVEIDGDPRGGLRVDLRGAELITEQREQRAAEALKDRTRRDAQTIRQAIGRQPGLSVRDLRVAVRPMSRDRFEAAMVHLRDELEVREERRGKATAMLHYLKGCGHG